MKYGQLRAIAHNVAASLASGNSFILGHYGFDVFDEAAKTVDGSVIIDFLHGETSAPSQSQLKRLAQLYRKALPRFFAKHGISVAAFTELSARYTAAPSGGYFEVTFADRMGRRTTTDYVGYDGHRAKILDHEGRVAVEEPAPRPPVQGRPDRAGGRAPPLGRRGDLRGRGGRDGGGRARVSPER